MADLEKIITQLEELTLPEVAELKSLLEDRWGVTAAAPMMMGAMPMAGAGGEAAAAEPTSFNVVLKEAGSQKIPVIKEVRAITGLGLKEAKDLVDNPGKPLKEGVEKAEAEDIKSKLEAVGATVELQPA
jgi:large subunit ribosomal protein L7/L12